MWENHASAIHHQEWITPIQYTVKNGQITSEGAYKIKPLVWTWSLLRCNRMCWPLYEYGINLMHISSQIVKMIWKKCPTSLWIWHSSLPYKLTNSQDDIRKKKKKKNSTTFNAPITQYFYIMGQCYIKL